jgi:hypothetical protein
MYLVLLAIGVGFAAGVAVLAGVIHHARAKNEKARD